PLESSSSIRCSFFPDVLSIRSMVRASSLEDVTKANAPSGDGQSIVWFGATAGCCAPAAAANAVKPMRPNVSRRTTIRSLAPRPSSTDFARSLDPQVDRGFLAPAALDLIFDALSVVERAEPGALDGRNVDEYVLAAAGRLNEPISLGRIEPLHGTSS